jgi:pyruvate kinase
MVRRTKIIATIGPSTSDPEILKKLLQKVDAVRINLAHGSWDGDESNHRKTIKNIQKIARKINKPISILADLKGNKLRVGDFKNEKINLVEGSEIIVRLKDENSITTSDEIHINSIKIMQLIEVGDQILLDDGLIQIEVIGISKDASKASCKIIKGGELVSRKGFEVKDKTLKQQGLTDRDKKDLKRLSACGVDWIALSFVNHESDVTQAKEILNSLGSQALVISKIERAAALEQLDEIINASDGIMVARGDLALQVGSAHLTGLQKEIIEKTVVGKKIVITATQMMESMIHNQTPTRAEITDVSNAVLDGTDAVMLSAETAIGEYPLETVSAMAEVCEGAEQYQQTLPETENTLISDFETIDEAIAIASMRIAKKMNIKAIIALTETGSTAIMMSRLRYNFPIYAFTKSKYTQRRVSLCRGVIPYPYIPTQGNAYELFLEISKRMLHTGEVKIGDMVVLTNGTITGISGQTNTLRIMKITERKGK